MEFDQQVQLVLRIAKTITNDGYTNAQRVELASKWFGAAEIIATKWGVPVSEVLDIDDKLRETEDMFEPAPEEMTREQQIFWDYTNECNQFEHIEGE